MTVPQPILEKIQFSTRVVGKQVEHLHVTDQRLFSEPFTKERAEQLDKNNDLAERVEAFVSRFGRLQDTLGDKLLPLTLHVLGEKVGAYIENLDRAEKLGIILSVEKWMTLRSLRNLMVHEYIEDPMQLADALQRGHDFVPEMLAVTERMVARAEQRLAMERSLQS